MEKVIITTFTDPMMGLSYECEPIFRKLETHYGDAIEFHYVMAGLVRDVSDFMTPEELSLEPEEGVSRYCKRLAQIYKDEESISGMPIHMGGFHLFDAELRSSFPLDIAYEAAKLTCPEKADLFLYNLRYATIVETRQTTRQDELLRVASITGIDEKRFFEQFESGAAEQLFKNDLAFTRSLGIYNLPTYAIEYRGETTLIHSLIGYEGFVRVLNQITNGEIKPTDPEITETFVMRFLEKHPLIHEIEIMEALDLTRTEVPGFLSRWTQYSSRTVDGFINAC